MERWKGSVWVTTAVGTRPMCRVSGAMREAMPEPNADEGGRWSAGDLSVAPGVS